MKQKIFKLMVTFISGTFVLLTACSKKDNIVTPPPGLSRSVQWTIDSIPGEPVAPVNNLYAIISVVNAQNQPVLTNQKLAISFDGKFKTTELELPAGTLLVTHFILINENNAAKFATPKAYSAKASLVNRPLPISFILPQPVLHSVPMEVLRIEATDTPESFGYPAGTFNNGGQNPGENNSYVKIKLRTVIQVGEILYDSIPATVLYTRWDENQQSTAQYITLSAGVNEISVPYAASKHHFSITKWGMNHELTVLKSQLQQGNLYTIGGVKQAQKLQSEITFKLVGSYYVPESRTTFAYENNGKLSVIEYYLRRQDNTPYLAGKDVFQYNNNQLQKINSYDENQQINGSTSFTWNTAGKVSGIQESKNNVTTTATVDYHYTAELGRTELIFNFAYSNTSNAMRYYQHFYGANRQADYTNWNNNDNASGQYQYDLNINPYVHMGWLNLFLSNSSKNNVVAQNMSYFGTYPTAVVYEFSYVYNSEGYPVELIRKYKSGLTNQHVHTTKTVYYY